MFWCHVFWVLAPVLYMGILSVCDFCSEILKKSPEEVDMNSGQPSSEGDRLDKLDLDAIYWANLQPQYDLPADHDKPLCMSSTEYRELKTKVEELVNAQELMRTQYASVRVEMEERMYTLENKNREFRGYVMGKIQGVDKSKSDSSAVSTLLGSDKKDRTMGEERKSIQDWQVGVEDIKNIKDADECDESDEDNEVDEAEEIDEIDDVEDVKSDNGSFDVDGLLARLDAAADRYNEALRVLNEEAKEEEMRKKVTQADEPEEVEDDEVYEQEEEDSEKKDDAELEDYNGEYSEEVHEQSETGSLSSDIPNTHHVDGITIDE